MKFRPPLKITGRISSITNSFVQAIIPTVSYTVEERSEALEILGLTDDNLSCVYCGSSTSDWDHLRPLVRGKEPTGYISEIKNLVPACGRCNQSKGASDWRTWMTGNAKGSPTTRGTHDVPARVERLEKFVAWGKVEPIPLEKLVPSDIWRDYWDQHKAITEMMRIAQEKAEVVAQHIAESHRGDSK